MSKVSPHWAIIDLAVRGGRENRSGVDDDVEATVRRNRLKKRLPDGCAVANIYGHGDGAFLAANFLRF